MATITLILGGARSGKSALATRLAGESGKEICYLATACAHDQEMAARIARHQQERPAQWQIIETPRALAKTILAEAGPHRLLLVDCLTLWLCNLLHDDGANPTAVSEQQLAQARLELIAALQQAPGELILVANEVGLGIIPMGELSRQFVDEAGRLNQAIAAVAQRVIFVAAGLPLTLKG